MNKFQKLISACLSIRDENIDTDQIIPAQFLKVTTREGLGKYLFYNWRHDEHRKPKDNTYFDDSNHRSAKILVVGNNFGCGSSREHAVWALMDHGFKAVISSSFGDIFYNNSLKNGLLPVILKQEELEKLFQIIEQNPKAKVTVDLEKQTVICHHELVSASIKMKTPKQVQGDNFIVFHFTIDPFLKMCLLKGVDELGYILSQKEKIKEFENQHKIYVTR